MDENKSIKNTINLTAELPDIVSAKELLDDLEALAGKYEITLDLKIGNPTLQECYALI